MVPTYFVRSYCCAREALTKYPPLSAMAWFPRESALGGGVNMRESRHMEREGQLTLTALMRSHGWIESGWAVE